MGGVEQITRTRDRKIHAAPASSSSEELAGLSASSRSPRPGQVDLFSIVPSSVRTPSARRCINAQGLKARENRLQALRRPVYGGDFLANRPRRDMTAPPPPSSTCSTHGVPSTAPRGLLDFRRFGGTSTSAPHSPGTTGQQSSRLDEQVLRHGPRRVKKYEVEFLSPSSTPTASAAALRLDLRSMQTRTSRRAIIVCTGGIGAIFAVHQLRRLHRLRPVRLYTGRSTPTESSSRSIHLHPRRRQAPLMSESPRRWPRLVPRDKNESASPLHPRATVLLPGGVYPIRQPRPRDIATGHPSRRLRLASAWTVSHGLPRPHPHRRETLTAA